MAKMNRKKALDAMVKAHNEVQSNTLVRFQAEGMESSALFPHREEIIEKIMRGVDPAVAIDDAVGAAIRLHRISLTSNTKVPSFRDLLAAEDLELLKSL
ncbi:hypothetical protein HOU08_gp278 [Dickeya phage vB_DsoM_JA29]|uniref:Uncharacterized protein n=1 Tax=Dickeya phage vB_DsoM_JA29 TaxID=2283031 RepID=A0A384ZXP3_9CAUD|nr:hypothetical protein HOU08_gp278 [Dickeya phage vB_DsoM_JA29]AXG67004.1 hypothetical protein JA29_278 [Dickeya phage vB_DsoM_JA29]